MKSRSHISTVVLTMALVASVGAMAAAGQEADRKGGEMREVVSAGKLLSGQVKNLADPVGQVKDLILNEAKNKVEYVVFRMDSPWNSGEVGYLDYDSLKVGDSTDGRLNLQVQNPDVGHPPEKLTLTRGQVDRIVSRLLGQKIEFEDGSERKVEDLLVNPKTGKLTHFVVRMDSENRLFGKERRTISAKDVSISEGGRITTELTLADVET